MRVSDILNAKTLKYSVVTIVLGAVGSGAWEWFLRPALSGTTAFLLSVGTLGIETFKNSVYAEISRGLHEDSSQRIFSFIFSFLPGLLAGIVITFFLLLYRSKSSKDLVPVSDRTLAALAISLSLFLSAFCLIQAVQVAYMNRAVTHFNQLLAIASPQLREEERIMYRSKFAQIASRSDYEQLERSLKEVCRKANLRVPSFDVW